MSVRLETYKCDRCGHLVEIRNPGAGSLTCCGQAMTLLRENATEAAREKHVPVIEKIPGGYRVAVGSVPHPMEEKHFIQWIELIGDNFSQIKYLKPAEQPVAEFATEAAAVSVREYCNLHGLWKA